ncbi:BTB/POZ domain-containing protein 17-like [Amphiura filiformis]|uniref:BTB/POZ domain-containing protein 17-like n=1 Tax=Amphiura filiformis TaxID=82378 RepID=UPI003B2266A2
MAASTNVTKLYEPDETIFSLEESTLDGKTTFLHNLSQHFRSGDFSDVTLIVGNKRYSAHKAILAASSPYFQRMFYGGSWKEGSGSEVMLEEIPSCEEAFETFLRYFYSGSVTVTKKTVIPVVTLADKYDCQGLKEICSSFIADMLNNKYDVEAALGWVAFAEQMRMHALQQKCYDLISYNFDKACNMSGWLSLSFEQILTILKRSDIVASNEYDIFQVAQTWLLGHPITENEVKGVLAQVQFKNMTVEQLCQVEMSQLASHDVCTENNLLTPYLYDAFKYVAVTDHYPTGDKQPAEYYRCYKASELYGPLKTVTFNGAGHKRCANLTPKCTLTPDTKYYTWHFGKFGSSKYQIMLPRVSYDDYYETRRLYNALPGDICLKLLLIVRDKVGRTLVAMNSSFVTQIPRKEGKILVEFPECSSTSSSIDNPECKPHDVMYSFSIEKA